MLSGLIMAEGLCALGAMFMGGAPAGVFLLARAAQENGLDSTEIHKYK
jgi:hypothetical protein